MHSVGQSDLNYLLLYIYLFIYFVLFFTLYFHRSFCHFWVHEMCDSCLRLGGVGGVGGRKYWDVLLFF